jgi:L-iditol 2-dehydrogenase
MRASVLVTKGQVRIEERAAPVPTDDEVLIRVASVGVCGSDVHYYREGRIGDVVVDEPLVLGHEASGRVVAVGRTYRAPGSASGRDRAAAPMPGVRECAAGRYNLCLYMEFYATPPVDGAFQEYVTIQAPFAHPVPEAVSDDVAALLEPLSVGIWASRKAEIVPGSRVLIAGAGPMGVMATQVARALRRGRGHRHRPGRRTTRHGRAVRRDDDAGPVRRRPQAPPRPPDRRPSGRRPPLA